MAKKRNITSEKIIAWYMETILTLGKPKSVFSFAKENNFEESDFYKYFSNFKHLEKSIFGVFFDQTIALLNSSEEYHNYTSKDKLIGFYYTFFELLTANRSYILMQFNPSKLEIKNLSMLSELRTKFIEYIQTLGLENIDFKNKKINKLQEKTMAESNWLQLLVTMKFWINDNSKGFEKTDLFIEKSLQALFDVKEAIPIKSVVDFAKFLWKEKNQMR